MTAILDAASVSVDGVNVGTERLVRAFAQIKGAGRLLAEDLNQIQEVAPVRAILKERFGMSANEVAERSQAGEKGFDVDTIIGEILAGFKENYGGALAKQAEQLWGQLDQLSDRYRATAREIAKPLFEPLKSALSNLIAATETDSFDNLTASLVSVSEAIGPFITQLGLIGKFATIGGSATANATKAASVDVASTVTSTAIQAAGLVGSATKLFDKANDATGGALGKAMDAASLARQYSTPAGLRGMASDAIIGAGGKAVNAASDYVRDNQPDRQKQAKEPDATISAQFGRAASDAIASLGHRIGPLSTAFGTMATDRAAAFSQSTGVDLSRLPEDLLDMARDVQRGDAQREKDGVIKADDGRRFDSAVADMPARISKFAESIADPKIADAFKRSTFNVTQERGENGRMVPTFQLKELGEMVSRGSVESTDFSGLNSMVQSNIDNQRMKELAEKRNTLAEEANKFLSSIADKVGAPREATVAAG